MEIRTVAVMGAGAVGSYFIWGLHEKLGDRLWVVADGERKARLEQEGIVVNGSLIKPCVRTPEEARGADLLVVAVKYGALKTSLEEIAQVTDRHTVVMSVLNGVGQRGNRGRTDRHGAYGLFRDEDRLRAQRKSGGL